MIKYVEHKRTKKQVKEITYTVKKGIENDQILFDYIHAPFLNWLNGGK